MSPTTPTTVNHGAPSPAPSLNHVPTGSRPGHSRRAIASLMIATREEPTPSPAEKKRPLSNGNSEGAEKSRADLVSAQAHALGNRSRVALDRDGRLRASADEDIADNFGVLHPGNRLNLFQRAIEKVGPLLVGP